MSFDPNEEIITTQGDLKELIITACELRETELQKRIAELKNVVEGLREALESIEGQTNGFEADETYYGGVWMEVHYTAITALNKYEQGE